MKILILTVVAVLASETPTPTPTPTPPPPAPEAKTVWMAECELKNKKIQFEAKSVLGEKDSDDMKMNLVSDSTDVEIPISEGHLTLVTPTNKKFGICSPTAGLMIGKTRLLVLVGKKDNSNLDHLNAVLVDTENMKVLDTSEELGDFVDKGRNKIFLKKVSGGVSALIAQGWKKYAKSESPENLFMGWLNITVNDDKITSKWEMDLPDSHKPYKTNSN